MILTKQLIKAGKLPHGGYTNAQIEVLGFNRMDPWHHKALGMDITEEKYQRFLDAKNEKKK